MSKVKVKPVPPKDLWAQLEQHLIEVGSPKTRPEGSFTSTEFKQRFNIASVNTANKRLQLLQHAGKIKRFRSGAATYYVLVDQNSEKGAEGTSDTDRVRPAAMDRARG